MADPEKYIQSSKGNVALPESIDSQDAVPDPVCGMKVAPADAAASHAYAGTTYYFCSDHCHERFVADPSRYVGESVGESGR